jgi:hypothetical protein
VIFFVGYFWENLRRNRGSSENFTLYNAISIGAQQNRYQPNPKKDVMKDNQGPNHRKRDPTVRERRFSVMLLGILALIAGGMLWAQGRFDAGAWREQAQSAEAGGDTRRTAPPPVPQASTEADASAGVEPLAPAERYGPDTLSDKIDGKAELYLSAGFQSLESRRFALSGDKRRWMERYVYDMGGFRGAYAVFSSQRRPHIHPVAWTGHAYLAGNALFFVHGPYYVEIVGAEVSKSVQNGLESLAKAFIETHGAQAADPVELQLLPMDNRAANSVKLTARAVFGIQGLDWIFSAAYSSSSDQAEALAFVSQRNSPAEAEALADKFHSFWLEFGGADIAPPSGPQGARGVSILDNYEICVVRGKYLIGVHAATNLEFGMRLVEQLQRNIAGLAR